MDQLFVLFGTQLPVTTIHLPMTPFTEFWWQRITGGSYLGTKILEYSLVIQKRMQFRKGFPGIGVTGKRMLLPQFSGKHYRFIAKRYFSSQRRKVVFNSVSEIGISVP